MRKPNKITTSQKEQEKLVNELFENLKSKIGKLTDNDFGMLSAVNINLTSTYAYPANEELYFLNENGQAIPYWDIDRVQNYFCPHCHSKIRWTNANRSALKWACDCN